MRNQWRLDGMLPLAGQNSKGAGRGEDWGKGRAEANAEPARCVGRVTAAFSLSVISHGELA